MSYEFFCRPHTTNLSSYSDEEDVWDDDDSNIDYNNSYSNGSAVIGWTPEPGTKNLLSDHWFK